MPLLDRKPRQSSRPRTRPAPLPVALVGANAEVRVCGTLVTALPEGALWIASARALIVSDLHLEKASAFARGGQMLPPYDTRETLARLGALIDALTPDIVVSLGDSFHDAHGPWRLDANDAATLAGFIKASDWVWIVGNHDPHIPSALGGAVKAEVVIETLTLRHEPKECASPGEIAGHLHPCARVAGRGRSVRRRCFATDGERLVMPAFGAFTGGLNVRDAAFAPVFPHGATALVLGKSRVLPAAHARLIGD